MLTMVVACSIMFSSCIGSFSLTNKLLDWNRNVDSKLVNELVFLALCIVPVYGVSILADAVIFNSIEFWTDDNPIADVGTVKTIDAKDGVYTVETKADGYHIQKEGEAEAIDLVFDKSDKSWSVEANGESQKLLQFKENDEVVMFLPNGQSMEVELNQVGVLAFRQVANNYTYYAAR